MGTITERLRGDGTIAYLARVTVKSKGKVIFREFQTFDRRKPAEAWIRQLEKAVKEPGGVEREISKNKAKTLGDAINLYLGESQQKFGKTKAASLRYILKFSIADKACDEIVSSDIFDFAKELGATCKPQTVGNYLSHLGAVFAVAKPAWGVPLDPQVMKDALTVTKRMGVTSKSGQRDRRPTLKELDTLLTFFSERKQRVPQMLPMVSIILFALFSTRRQEEITRIKWADLEPDYSRVLVRDMKNPGEKIGNDVWCDLPEPAVRIIKSMPKKKDEIFPFGVDAIRANFTRACKLLGIDDLHFHDLRHEGITRLFEMGLNIPHVATVSGHRSWVSLKRYAHIRGTGDRYAGWSWLDKVAPRGEK